MSEPVGGQHLMAPTPKAHLSPTTQAAASHEIRYNPPVSLV